MEIVVLLWFMEQELISLMIIMVMVVMVTSTHLREFVQNVSLRFQVLMAASMKMAVFWVLEPCSLVAAYFYPEDSRV
jgi:hypothetical protein